MFKNYKDHIAVLQERTAKILKQQAIDSLIIHSGQLKMAFLDDHAYPFKVNPHFKHWLPLTNNPNCTLLVNGLDKPKLIFYRPEDFWHKVPDEPNDFWTDSFEIVYMQKPEQLTHLLPSDRGNMAFIGEDAELADTLSVGQHNPQPVMDYLHYHRSFKTPYELDCMRHATAIAYLGHNAAREAFYEGASEFDINQRYLSAVRQGDNQIPYSNIVALNENAAILHYTVLQGGTGNTDDLRSFLLDAGAEFHGYAADITRTYSYRQDEFADLIAALNEHQLRICDQIKVGMPYLDLHIDMHFRIAILLHEFGFIDMSIDQAVECGVTSTFYPHGLGHFLGLQVHDVAGFMQDETGAHLDAPAAHPHLRCTRMIERGQVFTIEPGLYFIPSLLAKLKQTAASKLVNWDKVEAFIPYGGIRIEDNIIVHSGHVENMTRDAGLV